MSLLVLAYPNLKEADYNWIQEFRKENDKLYFDVVEPHFTIVFPVFDKSKNEFIEEAKKQSKDYKNFDFEIKVAQVNKDSFQDCWHVFLVPEKGYGNIVKLHDKMYSGKLISNLRLNIDFIPHIGIGNSKEMMDCKNLVDKLNSSELSIKGSIEKLDVVIYEDNKIETLDVIKLK